MGITAADHLSEQGKNGSDEGKEWPVRRFDLAFQSLGKNGSDEGKEWPVRRFELAFQKELALQKDEEFSRHYLHKYLRMEAICRSAYFLATSSAKGEFNIGSGYCTMHAHKNLSNAAETSLQEQVILNSTGDGGNNSTRSNGGTPRITCLADNICAPTVHKLTDEDESQHHRGIDSAFKDDSLQATQRFIDMLNGTEGTTYQLIHNFFIMDSGAGLHCTGDRNLLSEYTALEQPDESIRAANNGAMPILGVGTIYNERFQIKDVKFMPNLNGANYNKTVFSVAELGRLGYHVHFDGASCSVIDNRYRTWSWKTWTWTHEIVGKGHSEVGVYFVDYLRIPADRVPVRRPTLADSFWKAASLGWTSMTGLLTRTQERVRAERAPV